MQQRVKELNKNKKIIKEAEHPLFEKRTVVYLYLEFPLTKASRLV